MIKKSKSERHRRGPRLAVFHPEFIADFHYWVERDRRVAVRAFDLIEAGMRDPFAGIGKPEPLKGAFSAFGRGG